MITMLNRMCWNSKGWLLPTHSSDDGGYPQHMGFGHEEWDFQVNDAVEDFVYGYLYYKPNESDQSHIGIIKTLIWIKPTHQFTVDIKKRF